MLRSPRGRLGCRLHASSYINCSRQKGFRAKGPIQHIFPLVRPAGPSFTGFENDNLLDVTSELVQWFSVVFANAKMLQSEMNLNECILQRSIDSQGLNIFVLVVDGQRLNTVGGHQRMQVFTHVIRNRPVGSQIVQQGIIVDCGCPRIVVSAQDPLKNGFHSQDTVRSLGVDLSGSSSSALDGGVVVRSDKYTVLGKPSRSASLTVAADKVTGTLTGC